MFAVDDDPELKKYRPDLIETLSKTLWFNPHYEGIGEECHTDHEGCFSVHDLVGPVKRFKTIKYEAYLPGGEKVQGLATAFLARVIQHEIDHIRGILFTQHVEPEKGFISNVYNNFSGNWHVNYFDSRW